MRVRILKATMHELDMKGGKAHLKPAYDYYCLEVANLRTNFIRVGVGSHLVSSARKPRRVLSAPHNAIWDTLFETNFPT